MSSAVGEGPAQAGNAASGFGPGPILSRQGISRGAALRTSGEALDLAWAGPGTRLLPITREGLIPLHDGALMALAPATDVRPADALYLGTDADGAWFACVVDEPPPGQLANLRDVGADLNERDAGLFVHALALANWHAAHRHCPRCGTPTTIDQGGHVRVCPQDGSQHFPRTDPAVIMLIVDPTDQYALLGRQPAWPPGRYSCLAGFVEAGESAEQAVIRESREEAGVEVREVRYVASQPWPFPASLMLGYGATADVDAAVGAVDEELEDVRWFHRAEITESLENGLLLPPPISIARHLVEDWLARPVP